MILTENMSFVHQIEEKYKDITVKDESSSLKKKISELMLVRIYMVLFSKSLLDVVSSLFSSMSLQSLRVFLSAGEPAVKTRATEISDHSRMSAE